MNCTHMLDKYDIITNKWGVNYVKKNSKRYTPEFKKLVIETMQEEKLSYSETCRRFEVNSRDQIKSWECNLPDRRPRGFYHRATRPRRHRQVEGSSEKSGRRSAG